METIFLRSFKNILAAVIKEFLIKNRPLYHEKKLIIKEGFQEGELISYIYEGIGDRIHSKAMASHREKNET